MTPNEIRRRLNGYLRFMLDKDAASVTREEIHNVRDTLRKLPRQKHCRASCNAPRSNHFRKTVNAIVQAILGMYEWAIREQVLAIPPAKV